MRLDSLLQPISLQDRIRYHTYRRRYGLPSSFGFNGGGIVFGGDGEVNAGANSYIGSFSILSTTRGNAVRIGKDCRIGHRVSIYTSSNRVKAYLEGRDEYKYGDVVLGDSCWVGVNAYIGPNVVLPPRSIVPANAVVTRSPPGSSPSVIGR